MAYDDNRWTAAAGTYPRIVTEVSGLVDTISDVDSQAKLLGWAITNEMPEAQFDILLKLVREVARSRKLLTGPTPDSTIR